MSYITTDSDITGPHFGHAWTTVASDFSIGGYLLFFWDYSNGTFHSELVDSNPIT